nr:hypothetical protein CFP56_57863 [Quercus suber]
MPRLSTRDLELLCCLLSPGSPISHRWRWLGSTTSTSVPPRLASRWTTPHLQHRPTTPRNTMRGHHSTAILPAVRMQHGRRRCAAVHGLVRSASDQRRPQHSSYLAMLLW